MAKISIIVPVYNVEDYLKRCIDSLINQTMQDIEIILVDDGSYDSCPAICDRYAKLDKRIKVIHKKNGGVSAARNDGLLIATGEWVIFCDPDDWMELDGLEVLYNIGENRLVDVVVGDINRIKGNEIIYNRFFASEFEYHTREDMDSLVMADIYQNYCKNPPQTPTIGYGGPWNKLVRKDLLFNHGIKFDTSLMGIFDDILYTACVYANMSSIAYIQKPVYNYVISSTSITKSYKANTLQINRNIFMAFKAFISSYAPDGKWNRAYDAMVIRRFDESLDTYFFNKNNPKRLSQRLIELKKTINEEPYCTSSKAVEINILAPHQKRVAILLKTRSALAFWIFYILRQILRKA